jgi:hypothetical protein
LFNKKPADSLQQFIDKGIFFVFLTLLSQREKQQQKITKKTPNFPPQFFLPQDSK